MSSFTWKKFFANTAVAVAVVAGTLYCADSSQADKTEAAAIVTAIPVSVETVGLRKVQVWSEFSGRLQAVDSAEIRPEVSGRITEVRFEDGGSVKAGEVLFVIDPRPYEAAVAKAEALLATAKTNAEFARIEKTRAASMLKTQAIAQLFYDERAKADRVTAATVQVAEAELKQAKLDLEQAYVRAPISGRASRAELTVGNLVQAGANAPLLTTIVANNTVYADFDVDEQTYMQSIRRVANNRAQERQIPVELVVPGDKAHRYTGTIYSFDNRIDAASGTIRARAKFDNPDGALVPGLFVSVKLANGAEEQALLVPTQALGFDQSKKFVYVVGPDGKVAYREVTLGKAVAAKRIVLSGLDAGDRVIVDGIQHVRPGVVVDAEELADHGSDLKADLEKQRLVRQ
ncbi:MAG: efflux RND transporter periplasmic adaptor subunit [Gammaproteobacteria bacterium]|nr:efflux RND transporter periplasmic adaptor subunit [Gammaproteobacteria bacterium]